MGFSRTAASTKQHLWVPRISGSWVEMAMTASAALKARVRRPSYLKKLAKTEDLIELFPTAPMLAGLASLVLDTQSQIAYIDEPNWCNGTLTQWQEGSYCFGRPRGEEQSSRKAEIFALRRSFIRCGDGE